MPPDNDPAELAVAISWLPGEEVVVATVRGESDIDSAAVLEETLVRLVGRERHVVVDMTAVGFFDLTTIRVLLALRRAVEAEGHECVVVMDAWGRRVIGLAGLREELSLARTVDDAVEAVVAGARSAASC